MDELLSGEAGVVESYAMATVYNYSSSTGAQLTLDGESSASTKRYKRLSPYTPAKGDRVLLAKVSGTYVILGKVL